MRGYKENHTKAVSIVIDKDASSKTGDIMSLKTRQVHSQRSNY